MRLATLTYRARGALLFTMSAGALLAAPGLAGARAVHPCIKGWCQHHGAVPAHGSSFFDLVLAAMFVAVAVCVVVVECRKGMGDATPAPRVRRAPAPFEAARENAEHATNGRHDLVGSAGAAPGRVRR
jgi:hypothetical protein